MESWRLGGSKVKDEKYCRETMTVVYLEGVRRVRTASARGRHELKFTRTAERAGGPR